MKRTLIFILILTMLLLSLFTLFSCRQKKWIDFRMLHHKQKGTVIEYNSETNTTTLKFYIEPTGGYDVDDFKEVKIKFRIVRNGEYSKPRTEQAQIPQGARGNPELQYFYIVLENEKINFVPDQENYIYVVNGSARGVLKTDETMVDDDKTPSIFVTIILGIVMLVAALIASCLGLATRDDPRGQILIGIAVATPIFLNIASYFRWGAVRGIILSIFCVLIIVATIIASRFIDY